MLKYFYRSSRVEDRAGVTGVSLRRYVLAPKCPHGRTVCKENVRSFRQNVWNFRSITENTLKNI